VNLSHRRLCSSPEWARIVEEKMLPRVLVGVELGDDVLELGPGYGATTKVLAASVPRLTALEIDPHLAAGLREQLGGRIEVVEGDATRMPFDTDRFSAVLAFTMLHHVPSASLQDAVFRETCRVLRPGGVFVGRDSRPGWRLRLLHVFDTLVLLDPDELPGRLREAGFDPVEVIADDLDLRFVGRAPAA
jgi:SAM-dependent methyltransferase